MARSLNLKTIAEGVKYLQTNYRIMIMKMRNRSSYPDSPHPGHGHPGDWITKPYSIIFIGAVLFILILGIAIFLGWRQFETTRHNTLTADETTANLLADLILEHNKATIGILQSYASRPLFIAAVKNKDLAGVHRHLSNLKKNAAIDLTFVTDKHGLFWANFPVFPEAIGKNLSNRDWYKGVSSRWKPYISTVFKLIVGDKPPAVAVSVPIFDEKERVIGILGISQRLGFLVDTIERVPFSPYTSVNVLDRAGKIIYSNKVPYQESITDYRVFPILEPALKEIKQQIEMNDPQKDQEKSYLTVVPVGDIGWSVIIERSLKDIYRSEFRRFIEIGTVSFLLFLLIIFFLIYVRKVSLFRKTEELLQAEIKLRQSEENFHHSLDDSPMGVRIVTEEGKTIYANRAILDIYGYDSMEDLKTTPVEKRYTPESHADFLIRREKRQQGVDAPSEYTINIIRKDGEVRHLLVLRREILWDGERQFQVLYNDITERKRAEEAVRERDSQLKKLTSWVPGMIYQFTRRPDGTYCVPFTTEAIKGVFGCSPQDVREDFSPIARIILPEDFDKVVASIEYSAKHLTIWTCEYRVLIPGQPIRWILGNSTPEKLADGSITWYGFNTDITERKRAEEMIKVSEEKYRIIFDEAPMGIAISTIEGKIIELNKAQAEMIGGTVEELKGRSVNEYYVYADKRREMIELFKKTGKVRDFEMGLKKKDGSIIVELLNLDQVKIGGKDYLFATGRDITERKRMEEEKHHLEERSRKVVEDIFRFIPEGVLVFSRKMELLRQNQAFRELVSGYAQRLGFAEDELENLIVDKIKAAMGDKNIKEIRISRKYETGEQT